MKKTVKRNNNEIKKVNRKLNKLEMKINENGTSCRLAAATVCPRPSPPSVGAEAPSAAEHTAT